MDNPTEEIDEVDIEQTPLQTEPSLQEVVADDMIFEDDAPVQSEVDEVQIDEIGNEDVHAVVLEESSPDRYKYWYSGGRKSIVGVSAPNKYFGRCLWEHPEGIAELLTFLESRTS